jgi:sulfur-carrier protein adenylyltransferase/sulfurtransferase
MDSGFLTPRELRRYSNQIAIPEIGEEGQERLKNARVLVVGAGNPGCQVLQYLGSSGIGKIGIVDFDTVDESDLQSQVLYGSLDVGKLKVIIAKNWLERLNSLIVTEVFNLRLAVANAIGIIKQFDLVVDATNNPRVSYIINDSCVILKKPMVYGSTFKSVGEVSVFNFNGGSTYRCFKPFQKTGADNSKLPARAGQTGVQAGIAGSLMAGEVIKIITGAGSVLSGTILKFNVFNNFFQTGELDNIPENHLTGELKEED